MEVSDNIENIENEQKLLDKLKKFNWGAFLLTWIWGLGNKTYISLLVFPILILSLIPIIGWALPIAFSIWLGIKGNELAWNNKEWENIEHFDKIQRRWAIFGLIIILLFICWTIFLMILPVIVQ